jgi:hypothetical protein
MPVQISIVRHFQLNLIAPQMTFAYARRILAKWVILHKPPHSRSGLRSLR